MDSNALESLFDRVQKPARYTGGELNSVIKDKELSLIHISDRQKERSSLPSLLAYLLQRSLAAHFHALFRTWFPWWRRGESNPCPKIT